MDLYREELLDHYKHPHHFGKLSVYTHTASKFNATCGDKITFYLEITDGKVTDVSFEGVGCAISMAAASMLSDELIGKSIEEINKMKGSHMIELIGTELTPSRVKCATLPLEVVTSALVK